QEVIIHQRTADALVNGRVTEFKIIHKATNLKNAVQKQLRKGKRQAPRVLLYISTEIQLDSLLLGIFNAVKFDSEGMLQQVVIWHSGQIVELNRAEILDGSFMKKIKDGLK
ncbi:MAG: hypothetical protein M3Q97_08420, partial [Bacteroidota bacterium]|nr:hypothetical protein [Bacteroidota bacterium]